MIADSNKFIFVHLPKTGTNSIHELLKKYLNYIIASNKPDSLPFRNYFTPKKMDLVKRKFKCEIDTFGYEF